MPGQFLSAPLEPPCAAVFAAASLPDTGFLRLAQIIGDPKATPPIPARIPVGRSTWWQGIKDGRFPPPVKLGPRITAWPVQVIKELIAQMEAGAYATFRGAAR